MKLIKTMSAAIFMLAAAISLYAQPARTYVRVEVAPENSDWVYKQGEKIKFNFSVLKNDIPLEDIEVRYEISEDMMPAHKSGTLTLKKGSGSVDAASMNKPGFLRCRVWATYQGKQYEGLATAAVDAGQIQPTVQNPPDFDDFWNKAKEELARVAMDPVLTLIPERCTANVDVYQLSLKITGENARVYGILCKPKAEGKYPVVLHVPGAGIRPYYGEVYGAEKGYITLVIGIHGVPVDMPQEVYNNMAQGPLREYHRIRLDDRNNYYYKRVYLGCVRAVDYLVSLPEFDGKNMIVQGGSQGGALAIVTAGLDDRITGLVSFYPALSDITGYHSGRAGGWPHMFRSEWEKATPEKLETIPYYDVVNFARRIKVPGYYSLGYNDMVCPPTSMFSAINLIDAPKEVFIVEETGHYTYPEQRDRGEQWKNKMVGK